MTLGEKYTVLVCWFEESGKGIFCSCGGFEKSWFVEKYGFEICEWL